MRVPDIKVPPPGPRAKALLERDRAVVSPSYPRSAPFVMARGEGCVVEVLVHGLLLGVVAYFLFRPQASAYFRRMGKG